MKKLEDLKTFEQACELLGLDPKKIIPDFQFYPEQDRAAMIAHAKLVIIIRAANMLSNDGKEWIPDYNNYDEYKYEPWFDLENSPSGCRLNDVDYWITGSDVGSRLCFISRATCKYIVNQFLELYKEYFL